MRPFLCSTEMTIPSSRPAERQSAAHRRCPGCRHAAPAKPAQSVLHSAEHGATIRPPKGRGVTAPQSRFDKTVGGPTDRYDPMNLLSIQSHVAFGHVGNAAATFPLQRLGIEVWPIHTVQFSNHTGYGQWRGRVFEPDVIGELVQGIEERGVLGACDGVLSGYMGSAEIGAAILDAVARVKGANPAAQYCCDPVIGDVGRGVFVRPGIPEFMAERAVPAADIVTPNQFELEHLAGRATPTLADVQAAVDAVHARGPGIVLVTSLHVQDTPDDAIDVLVSDANGRWRV